MTNTKPTKVYAVWLYTIVPGYIEKHLVNLFYNAKQAEDYANDLAEKYRQKSSTTTYTTSVTVEEIK